MFIDTPIYFPFFLFLFSYNLDQTVENVVGWIEGIGGRKQVIAVLILNGRGKEMRPVEYRS